MASSEFLEILSPDALAQLKEAQALVDTMAKSIKTINDFKSSKAPSGADKNIQQLNAAYKEQSNALKLVKQQLDNINAAEKQSQQLKQAKLATQIKENTLSKSQISLLEAQRKAMDANLAAEKRASENIIAETKKRLAMIASLNKQRYTEEQTNRMNEEKALLHKHQTELSQLKAVMALRSSLNKQRQAASEKQAQLDAKDGRIGNSSTIPGMSGKISDLKEAERAALANEKLSRAYNILSAQHTKAKNTLQDLIAGEKKAGQTQKEYNAELRKAQNEFNNLDKKVKKADHAVGNFSKNVGNYKSAMSGVSSLMGAFGISTGLYLAASIVKDIYQTTKELQSMDLALRMVSGSEKEFAENGAYITEIASKWGIEIKGLTQQYTQFYTASKGILSNDAIKEVFEGVAKSGAVMGLSVEKQSAAFYAFEQMMSKGIVTSEELKKQLGNAMPGAIRAAAMAYMDLHPRITDVQKAEQALLADMKKGAIDSATYVPLIVKNFEKLYGIETVNKVETLQAAQERLANSWTELVRSMNESKTGGITVFFQAIAGGLTNALRLITRYNTEWDKLNKDARGKGKMFGQESYETGNKSDSQLIKDREQILKEANKFTAKINALKKDFNKEGFFSEINPWSNTGEDLEKLYGELGQLEGAITKINTKLHPKKNGGNGTEEKNVAWYDGRIKDLKDEQAALKDVTGTAGRKNLADIKELERLRALILPKEVRAGRARRERTPLDFSEVTSAMELRKAELEAQREDLSNRMNNEQASLDERLKLRALFSAKSIEILDNELAKEKASIEKKATDDLIKNQVAFNNKDIDAKKRDSNILDISTRTKNELATMDVEFSTKWKNLTDEDKKYYFDIETQKREFKEQMNTNILQMEMEKFKRIADNEEFGLKHTLASRQKAFEEYVLLAKEELKLQYEIDMAKARSNEERALIASQYERARKAIEDIISPAKTAREETIKFIEGFTNGNLESALESIGLSSAKMFLDFDENGQSTFMQMWTSLETTEEKFALAFQAIGDTVQEALAIIGANSDKHFADEFAKLDKQKEVAIGFAGDSAAAKAKIEEEYEKKKKALELKQFKAKQRLAIANIAIDTAQAIVGLWVKPGFPAAIPMAVAMGALGAIQMGMVAAQKPPAYWTGTDNAEAGMAWTQERGREIITDKKGNIKDFGSDSGARLTKMDKGDVVYNAGDTKKMMFDKDLNGLMMENGISTPNIVVNGGLSKSEMREIMQDTLGGQTKQNINFDKSGFGVYISRNGNITRRSEDRGNGNGLTL